MIYKLNQAAAQWSALLPDVLSNRSIVLGGQDVRTKFCANVAASVSTGKQFLQRKPTTTGEVLLFLPNHGQSGQYATLVNAAEGDRENISWTYDMKSFLAEDLSKYELVVVDELARAFGIARGIDQFVADVTLVQHLLTAKNLLVTNGYSEPKNGSLSATGAGESTMLDGMLTRVSVSPETVEIDNASGNGPSFLKLDTRGATWMPPKPVVVPKGDWV